MKIPWIRDLTNEKNSMNNDEVQLPDPISPDRISRHAHITKHLKDDKEGEVKKKFYYMIKL